MRLISYIKNPIDYSEAGGREYITIDGIGPLKAGLKGRGFFYSWVQGVGRGAVLNCQFYLQQTTQAGCSTDESGKIFVELETQPRPPCVGIRTSTGEGFIISPALKLEPIKGKDIVLMIITPRSSPYQVAVEKTILAIQKEETEVTVTSNSGELQCSGAISDEARTAHVILNRNPELPIYKAGFNQTISELKGQGQISATWKPVARTFEELLFAFYPSSMSLNAFGPTYITLDTIANPLGAPGFGDPGELTDFVIGDGPPVKYSLCLKIDRGLGRHTSDETRLIVT